MASSSDYLDTVFDALSSPERRYSLRYVREHPGDFASLDDVASYLSAETGRDRTAVMTGLAHKHLPKLEDYGFIEYDRRIGGGDQDTAIVDRVDTEDDRILLEYLSDTAEQDDGYVDAVFDTLSNTDRRHTLYVLEKEQDRRSTLLGLANYLAPDARERSNTIPQLHNVTLPKLQDQGWVEYDPTTQKVTLDIDPADERDQLLLQYLERAYDEEVE